MNRIIFTLLIITWCFSCKGQVRKEGEQSIDSINENSIIIDPIIAMPFTVDKKCLNIVLPDSLGGMKATGKALLSIFIDNNGVLRYYYIDIISIHNAGKELIKWDNFSHSPKSRIQYPLNVKKYYSFFRSYLETIKIIRTGQISKEINELSLPVRIGFK